MAIKRVHRGAAAHSTHPGNHVTVHKAAKHAGKHHVVAHHKAAVAHHQMAHHQRRQLKRGA